MLTHRDALDPASLHGRVVVVLDVIFATTTMIAAFARGIRDCIPAADEHTARDYARTMPDSIVAGEKNARVLDGFAHFAPVRLTELELKDRTLIFCSSNGAPALTKASTGEHVYAGALLNRAALCRHLLARHDGEDLIIVCAGSGTGFCLEDFYAAGAFVSELQRLGGRWALDDSALAATAAFAHYGAEQALFASRVGRLMSSLDLDDDLHFSARTDVMDVVPRMRAERLIVT